MKLVTYRRGNHVRPGIVVGEQVVDVQAVADHSCPTMIELLQLGESALYELGRKAAQHATTQTNGVHGLNEVTLEAPVLRPGKIIGVGLNYRDHAAEQGKEPPKSPMIFAKFVNTVTSHQSPIELPPNSTQVDFEAELCVVIGRTGRRIAIDEAMDYVAGYTIINDVTARDMQYGDRQFVRGKSCDTFAPLGPWVVLKDEIPNPHVLAISLTLNGKTMQSSNTEQLIFNVPYLISYLSQSMTFEAGDLIATGTPSGVGVYRQPPVFLKPGDVVSITIENIGTLTNEVRSPEEKQ